VLVVLLVVRLGRARAEAGRTARTDVLTGLPNRRAIDDMLERATAHASRTGEPLSVLMIDLDHFKAINDDHGHDAGDAVLQACARALRATSRAGDVVGRWGGEEFLVVLPATDLDGAVQAAERLRAAVSAAEVAIPRGRIHVTASGGVAVLGDGADTDALVRDADAALYEAKRGGRNAIAVARPQAAARAHQTAGSR
jgi:two-component system, cell cycle response regulator